MAAKERSAIGLAELIGSNARRIRMGAGVTLNQVGIAARRRGLKWNESRVADFEAGRVAPNLGTLAAICVALTEAGCNEATVPTLLHSDVPVQINDRLRLQGTDLANLLSGHAITEPKPLWPAVGLSGGALSTLDRHEWKVAQRYPYRDSRALQRVMESSGSTEERIAKTLGISSALLTNLSTAFWKRSFSQERDRRAGAGANAQKRGQVSRQMRAELEAAIRAETHGDDQ
jgi:transcriptional regulator with XRE-family HTH domain